MKVISVVRDYRLYNSLVRYNKFNKNNVLVDFDNSVENKCISNRYNDFLDRYDYSKPDWFVFCHEDWEVKEDLEKKLRKYDKQCLYGPIGVKLFDLYFFGVKNVFGKIKHSWKDGTQVESIGIYCYTAKKVSTFDCQCLIVHSDLIKKYNLMFDENLSWDLYVEDFCINAKEKFSIDSRVLQIKCQHHSKGNLHNRYFEHLNYLQKKYKASQNTYVIPVTKDTVGKSYKKKIINNSFSSFFYSNKITKKGNRLIKICKIPIYSRKVR